LAYYKEGDFDFAGKALRKAIKLKPLNANYRYVLGQLLADWRKLEGGMGRYIELAPSYIEARYNRGLLYDKLGESEKACNDFKQVIMCMPTFYTARHNLGVLHIKQQQWDEAGRVFEEILEVEPQYADVHCHLAEVYSNRYNSVAQAIDYLQHAIKHEPSHSDARLELGLLYAQNRYTRSESRDKTIDQFIDQA
jgi:tetratricopeptide (TPR) repeat protein